ncbi:transglycosylase family protein [Patulibacter americanus]|uniref:transglycosylase family protein n=1 Tax=Patulibacter americanus TaxID=588672 RepID=UPI000A012C06|nr:transglycosylase family protein [Patulibacter americanus]
MRTNSKITAVAFATAALAAGAPAAASAAQPSGGLTKAYDTVYDRVVDAGGQPGRNIAEDGIRKGGKARAATRAEVLESLGTLRSMHLSLRGGTPSAASAPAAAPSSAGQAAAPATSSAGAGSGLESVAQCESGGNPAAVSPDGQYRGKYQFDQQTWESVGGSGDPAAAPEAVQDQKAAQLQAQRGSSPWPVCG